MPERILLLQDDASRAAVVREMLAQSSDGPFAVEWVRSCARALDRLNDPTNDSIAAILIDLRLPDGQAPETFDRIFEAASHIPILILSDPEQEDVAKHTVQRGAQDYIPDDRLDSHSLSKALSNMLERAANAEALFIEKERAQVTLNSIGDAVISTDVAGKVTYLNQVAEAMTGWTSTEAVGRAFIDVFRIVDTRNPEHVMNPMAVAMQQNKTVGLSGSCILIRRDGIESPIEDSAATIHDRRLSGSCDRRRTAAVDCRASGRERTRLRYRLSPGRR
jgi:PAS domain S-box-containing protein